MAKKDERLPKLGGRLSRIMELLPARIERFIDVGTDHAWLPIYLVREGRTENVLACDIRTGPLARAQKNIARAGYTAQIKTELTDGLAGITLSPDDYIVIAGMGGVEILGILQRANAEIPKHTTFVLQPMRSLPELRNGLVELGFATLSEQLSSDDRRYYPLLKVRKTDVIGPRLSNLEAEIGTLLPQAELQDACTKKLWPLYVEKLAGRLAKEAEGARNIKQANLAKEIYALSDPNKLS